MSADVRINTKRLTLRHTWTTTMASSDFRETVHVAYERDGIVGYGEGAPIARYGVTPAAAVAALEAVRPLFADCDPWQAHPVLAELRDAMGTQHTAALSACDMALADWCGKRLGMPVYKLLGIDPGRAPLTSFSIGIGSAEETRAKVLEAAAYPVLKVKLGLGSDEATISAIRSVTDKPLRVDANEGWTSVAEAVEKICWLETQEVELIEQPMPAAMLDEMREVRARVRLPIFADEACTSVASITALRGSYDGINVKLDKAGGMRAALGWIAVARACGLRVMLGCMVESSVAITAAAHLAGLVDVCDLDGALLLADDPFRGVEIEAGRLILNDAHGLGVLPRSVPTPHEDPAEGPVVPARR